MVNRYQDYGEPEWRPRRQAEPACASCRPQAGSTCRCRSIAVEGAGRMRFVGSPGAGQRNLRSSGYPQLKRSRNATGGKASRKDGSLRRCIPGERVDVHRPAIILSHNGDDLPEQLPIDASSPKLASRVTVENPMRVRCDCAGCNMRRASLSGTLAPTVRNPLPLAGKQNAETS